jgi:hypothetical protein
VTPIADCGLLFLYDATGKRHIASISIAVIPKFD